jgi:hypothetical protein
MSLPALSHLGTSRLLKLLKNARLEAQLHRFHLEYLRNMVRNAAAVAEQGQAQINLTTASLNHSEMKIGRVRFTLADSGAGNLIGIDEPYVPFQELQRAYYAEARRHIMGILELSRIAKETSVKLMPHIDEGEDMTTLVEQHVNFGTPELTASSSVTDPDSD